MSDTITLDTLRRSFDDPEGVTVLPPVHPGEILREDVMAPLGLTAGTVARALHLPRSRIERVIKAGDRHQHRLWLNLQTRFESETVSAEIGAELERMEPEREAAA